MEEKDEEEDDEEEAANNQDYDDAGNLWYLLWNLATGYTISMVFFIYESPNALYMLL